MMKSERSARSGAREQKAQEVLRCDGDDDPLPRVLILQCCSFAPQVSLLPVPPLPACHRDFIRQIPVDGDGMCVRSACSFSLVLPLRPPSAIRSRTPASNSGGNRM